MLIVFLWKTESDKSIAFTWNKVINYRILKVTREK